MLIPAGEELVQRSFWDHDSLSEAKRRNPALANHLVSMSGGYSKEPAELRNAVDEFGFRIFLMHENSP